MFVNVKSGSAWENVFGKRDTRWRGGSEKVKRESLRKP
jgi:hypothetical protein